MKQQAKECFDIYKETIFSIDNDLRFWRIYLKSSFDNSSGIEDMEVNTAIFCGYDHDFDKIGGNLRCHEKVYTTMSSELEKRRVDFFVWIMNLSVLRAYNALEILLLQAIQIVYYPNFSNPIEGKKQTDAINAQIKEFLKSNSVKQTTKNNDHIIQFLKHKSIKIKTFLDLPMNIDLTTKWGDFFCLISILRNVIAHNGAIVQPNVRNQIKSISKDIFERHFEIIPNVNGLPTLCPHDDIFANFITYVNSLSINIYKFIFNENDLTFIDLK